MTNIELETNEPKTQYELSSVTLSEDAASVKALLAKHNAQVLNERPVMKIQLAYKINKEGFGFMSTIDFLAETSAVVGLKQDLELDKDVIRAIVVKKQKEPKRREGRSEKEEAKTPTGPQKLRSMLGSMLTNEALEKKIEEILQ